MPTYEYVCPNCGASFDLFQSMRDDPIKECPQCHKLGVKRLVGGGAGLIFKGSGFYITDYRNKKDGGKEGGGEPKPATSGGETKPAPATPAPASSSPAPASAPAAASDKK